MNRPSWNAYFLDLARTVATRATCPRRQVGCVLVRDRVVLSSGYNGAIRGADHCGEDCTEGTGHCVNSIHAEANAILSAARTGVALDDCTAYVTVKPCLSCYRNLVNAGVVFVYYAENYGPEYETSYYTRMHHHTEPVCSCLASAKTGALNHTSRGIS